MTKKINVIYVTMARIPGEKAHSIQIARTCNYLSLEKVDVTLLTPLRGWLKNLKRRENIYAYIENYYGMKRTFRIIHVRIPDIIHIKKVGWYIMVLVFSIYSALFIILLAVFNRIVGCKLVVYTREPLIFLFNKLLTLNLVPMVYEMHDIPNKIGIGSLIFISSLKKASAIITISEYQKHFLVEKNICRNKPRTYVVHNSVDEKIFLKNCDKENKIHVSNGKKVVLYCGQLYRWKNPEFMVKAFSILNRDDACLVFVGGSNEDIERVRQYSEKLNLKNVKFLGHKNPSEIPSVLKSADILIHYHPPLSIKSSILLGFLSLKIFEYMLARKPIVAPRNPGVTEVLRDGDNALLFNPSDPADMADKMRQLLDNPKLGRRLAEKAYSDALGNYTYRMRARKIKSILEDILFS